MLKTLRFKLTLLYLLVAGLMVALVSVSSYTLFHHYLLGTNDLALKYKMVVTFQALGAELPDDLVQAEQSWLGKRDDLLPFTAHMNEEEVSGAESDEVEESTAPVRAAYEGELSAIFVYPLDASGRLVFDPNPFLPPMAPNLTALRAALANGSDLRTVTLKDGTPVRLFTYPIAARSGCDQFVVGLLLLGLASIGLLGVGSWWLAGRSLVPTQRAWETQQIFVANASHELRTPLTLLRASAEVALRKAGSDPAQQVLLKNVLDECDHMTQLVEDLLLLSRLDAGQLTLDRQILSLTSLAGEVLRQFELVSEGRTVKLSAPPQDVVITGDRIRLRQVLLILLDNALRHSAPDGQIEVRIQAEGRSVRLSVADTGEGIHAQHLTHVFERFYQAKPSIGEAQGFGLGLSIARSLVEAHGGRIAISSQVGRGTLVWFDLPTGHTRENRKAKRPRETV
jgi:signal transduction histidine kinase